MNKYEVAYWEDTGIEGRSTMTEETTSTSLTVSGLKCNTDYNFTVRANGESLSQKGGVGHRGWRWTVR